MKDLYPHWGACDSCGIQRDLDENLLCKVCAEALETARALLIVSNLQFVQVLSLPKPVR